MVRVKGKVKKVLRKAPVKAGENRKFSGGIPVKAVIRIMNKKNG